MINAWRHKDQPSRIHFTMARADGSRAFAGNRPVAAGWKTQVANPLRRWCAAVVAGSTARV
ncbi:hypothetical protein [Dactylosporangium sp. NPDC050588]|uniref:hypothetical protein n=1 Tax=Dactylosporangium sp. NPDC050588 TaxID=3157211 RepID=UPI0033C5BB89